MMTLFGLLVIAAIAYAAGWRPQLGQWVQTGSPSGGADNPQQILRERYARGEISLEEYQRMRTDLQD